VQRKIKIIGGEKLEEKIVNVHLHAEGGGREKGRL